MVEEDRHNSISIEEDQFPTAVEIPGSQWRTRTMECVDQEEEDQVDHRE